MLGEVEETIYVVGELEEGDDTEVVNVRFPSPWACLLGPQAYNLTHR